jgi:putative oxidoreductase
MVMTHTPEQPAPPRRTTAPSDTPTGFSGDAYSIRACPPRTVVERADAVNARFAPTALRVALAVVFVWFRALKVAGTSPVRELIPATLPFISRRSVPVLGGVEVVIGLILLIGRVRGSRSYSLDTWRARS